MQQIDLRPFLQQVEQQQINMEGILLWQRGQEVARHFFRPEYRRNQFSVSKSFTSAAVGFALEEGLFCLEDPVLKYFTADAPANPDANLQALTIEHLLTMAPGQDTAWLMGGDRPALAAQTDDFVKFVLSRPFPYAPGSYFHYNNMGPYLAGILIQRLTGMNLVDYLMPRLFAPLGIPRPHWETDPKGFTFGAGGLEISLSELFSFIKLYYDYGKHEGRQLLSRAWIETSTAVHSDNSAAYGPDEADNRLGYGYLFWRGQHNSFRADGKYAKFAIVLRDIDAIAVINAHEPRQQLVLDTFWETLYPQLAR